MRKIYSLLLALFAVCGLASANVITITPTDVSGNDGLIVFECDKADGSTAPAYNATGKDVRVYAKGTFSVACVNGNMSQIVFHISTQGKKRLTSITSNVGQVATQAAGDETVTWTGDAPSVIFTVGEKAIYGSDGESKAGQFDFTSFDVTVGAADPNFVAPPTFSPAPGTYYEPQAVTISAGEDCSIWYTTDGSSPVDATGMTTDFAQRYEAPFMVNETTTIQAIAVKDAATAFLASEVVTATYTIEQAQYIEGFARMKGMAHNLADGEKKPVTMSTNGFTVIGLKGSQMWAVDYTGEGILIYGSNPLDLKVGDTASGGFTGVLQLYHGAAEITDLQWDGLSKLDQDRTVEPLAATIADLNGDNGVHFESSLVKLSGLNFGNATTFAKSNTASDASGTSVIIYDNFNIGLNGQAIGSDATYDITGIVGYYYNNNDASITIQVYPRSMDDIVQVSGGDPGIDPQPQVEYNPSGSGTLADPYNVDAVRTTNVDDGIKEGVWVKGVILGFADGAFNENKVVAGTSGAIASNIVIIDDAHNSVVAMPDLAYIAPVQLPNNDVRSTLNLVDNPGNLGQTVWLYGNIEKYFGVSGLKNVTKFSFDGENVMPSGDEPDPQPTIDWTSSADAPITVAQAMEKGGQLAPKADSGVDVYVKGFVSSVTSISNGKAQYYIADQMAGNTTQLLIYNGKGLQGADFADGALTQGDEVVVVGKIKNYVEQDGSSTIEMTGSKLYSLNGQTTGGEDPQPQVEYSAAGSGTLSDPYNVDALLTTEGTQEGVWVKGVIFGYVEGQAFNADAVKQIGEEMVATNIVIIDEAHMTVTAAPDIAYMAPVQLPAGDVRNALNLKDNSLVGRTVWLYGNIDNYFRVRGLKAVTKYSFDGENVLPSGDEPGPQPSIDWTSSQESPLTVGDVMSKASGLAANAKSNVEVYVKGVITEVKEISTEHGNATYMIADHIAGDANQLEVYRGKSLQGNNFTSDSELNVGDEVIVLGYIQHYVKSDGSEDKIEVAQGNKLISINGQGEPTPQEAVLYTSVPEMRRAARQVDGKQACELNTNGLTVIGVKGKQIWAVDYTGEGGILIYGNNTLNLEVGTTFGGTLKGNLQMFNGVAELNDADFSSMSVLPAAQDVVPMEATIADLNSDFVRYESGLVIISDLNFGEATAFAQNTTAYDESDNEIVIRDNFSTYAGQAITVGADYNVTGIVAFYGEAPQLYPRSIDDIIKAGEADLLTPTSEWSSDNVFCGPGETVNVQFTTNSDGAVTYTSSDESVAVVDAQGVITTIAAGTATITATTAGTATYRSSSDWVNVIVTAAAKTVDEVLATWDGEKIANTTVQGYIVGYVNGQSYKNGAVFFRTRNEAPATRAADDEVSNTNLLIATNKEETDVDKCMPVQLPAGNVRESLNLRDHSELAFAEVELYGDVDKYFGVCGLKGVSAFRIVSVDDAVRSIVADVAADAAIYTIDGRRLTTIHRPGLYIIGGRKVVVK